MVVKKTKPTQSRTVAALKAAPKEMLYLILSTIGATLLFMFEVSLISALLSFPVLLCLTHLHCSLSPSCLNGLTFTNVFACLCLLTGFLLGMFRGFYPNK